MAQSELQPAIDVLLAKREGINTALAALGYAEGDAPQQSRAESKPGRKPAPVASDDDGKPRAKRGELREKILQLISKKGPIKSRRIAELLDKEQSYVISTCSKLIEEGLIEKDPEDKTYTAVKDAPKDADDDDDDDAPPRKSKPTARDADDDDDDDAPTDEEVANAVNVD